MSDLSLSLQEKIKDAHANNRSLQIVAGDSKSFYGRSPVGEKLLVNGHTGIINYEPTELVITARSGTPIAEIESVLAENNQMLAFEPPCFADTATLGGTIACNLSGPRRPYAGAARDYVLGAKILNGKGEILKFGGEVMKNVAGYDVSRLMCGALGCIGLLLEISLKVIPRAEHEVTLVKALGEQAAIEAIAQLSGEAIPISASLYDGDALYLRLCGTARGVSAARQKIGGDEMPSGELFWDKVKEHTHGYFASDLPLWRLSVAPYTPPLKLKGKWLLDWGGAQRWLLSEAPAEAIRAAVQQVGGHAGLFRNGDHAQDVFHPLPEKMLALHRNLKKAFDPAGIFNPGRMYKEF